MIINELWERKARSNYVVDVDFTRLLPLLETSINDIPRVLIRETPDNVPYDAWFRTVEFILENTASSGQHTLLESIGDNNQMQNLREWSVKNPQIGEFYVPVLTHAIDNNVKYFDINGHWPPTAAAKPWELVDITDNDMVFDVDGKITKYPCGKSDMIDTLIFAPEDYSEFVTHELLKDRNLPGLGEDYSPINENDFDLGDMVEITGRVVGHGLQGRVRDVGRDGAFVVVDLGREGVRSFQATDVSRVDDEDLDEHGGGIGPKQHWQDLAQEDTVNTMAQDELEDDTDLDEGVNGPGPNFIERAGDLILWQMGHYHYVITRGQQPFEVVRALPDTDFDRAKSILTSMATDSRSPLRENKSKIYSKNQIARTVFETFDDYRRWTMTSKSRTRGQLPHAFYRYSAAFADPGLLSEGASGRVAERQTQAKSYINKCRKLDLRNKTEIAVGKELAVVSTTAIASDDTITHNGKTFPSTIEFFGFIRPSKIVDIHENDDGDIDTIFFENGQHWPERGEMTTVDDLNITAVAFYPDSAAARMGYGNMLKLAKQTMEPNGWRIREDLKESQIHEDDDSALMERAGPVSVIRWGKPWKSAGGDGAKARGVPDQTKWTTDWSPGFKGNGVNDGSAKGGTTDVNYTQSNTDNQSGAHEWSDLETFYDYDDLDEFTGYDIPIAADPQGIQTGSDCALVNYDTAKPTVDNTLAPDPEAPGATGAWDDDTDDTDEEIFGETEPEFVSDPYDLDYPRGNQTQKLTYPSGKQKAIEKQENTMKTAEQLAEAVVRISPNTVLEHTDNEILQVCYDVADKHFGMKKSSAEYGIMARLAIQKLGRSR